MPRSGRARVDDGSVLQTDAAALFVRNHDALMLIGGTTTELTSPQGSLKVALQPPGCLAAEWTDGTVTCEAGESLQYETLAGDNYSLQQTNRAVDFSGTLWRIGARHPRITGQSQKP
ncbi:MAG TPA: hypothetical protein VMU04_00645 [Candidatus Acidoferrum sp.]|nr:hypothetical protein [Candidatus Acidoferrum sp.]